MQGNIAQESGGNLASVATNTTNIPNAIGTAGSAIPSKLLQVGGSDGTNARAIKTNTSGQMDIRPLTSSDQVTTVPSGTQNTNTSQIGGATVATAASGIPKVGLTDGSGNAITSTSSALDVNIKSGSSSGTQYANGSAQATPTGTVALGFDGANVRGLKTDTSGNLSTTGNVASGSADSGNPVKVGGVYNTTQPTLSNGQRGDLQMTANGSMQTNLNTLLAGEDLTNNKLVVEQRNVYSNVTATGTTTVKSGANFLHSTTINNPSAITSATANTTITLYDNTAASGTKIGTISLPQSTNLVSALPFTIPYNVTINTGLTVVITVGSGGSWTPDLTINTRV